MNKTILVSLMLLMNTVYGNAQTVNSFVNYTDSAGLIGLIGAKGAWGDYNNDGWVDLQSRSMVYRNDGGVSFTPVATLSGEAAIWGDYDNDGLLDLFSYSVNGGGLHHNEGNDTFTDVSLQLMPVVPSIACRGATWGDFDLDGFLDLYIGGFETWPTTYYPDYLYMNNGDGTFSQTWSTTADPDPARGITACDFDEDGDLDIYVSNYRLEANILWLNDGDGNFTNVEDSFNVAGTNDGWSSSFGHSIGASWGDLDNDGDIDLLGGNFSHPDAWQDRPFFYENLGPDSSYHFADRSATAGLAWQESYASPAFADFDNDGYLDLFYTTLYPGDFPVLYRNNGNWTFTDVTDQAGVANIEGTHQAAFADFNNDGAIDFVSGGRLYKNSVGNNNWLHVNLTGTCAKTNSSAIGAQVRLYLDDEVMTRLVEGSTGEGNQNDLRLHFGLDSMNSIIDSLVVFWPGGNHQTIYDVSVNQIMNILEDPIIIDLPESIAIELNDSVTLGPSVIGPYDYYWSTGDTTAQITVSPDSSTTYYLTVTDSNCVKTDSVLVVLNISNIEETEFFTDRLLIAPNPFSSRTKVTFENPMSDLTEIKIFDSMGRMVRRETMINSQFTLEKGNLKSGVYILELSNEAIYRKRIIVN